MKTTIILEPGMSYHHEIEDDTLRIFSPWNGAVLVTIPRITCKYTVSRIMEDLNKGITHIHSQWVWYGSYGNHVPVIR